MAMSNQPVSGNSRIIDIVGGQATHQQNFLFIWDDSQVGIDGLEQFLVSGPKPFRDHLSKRIDVLRAACPSYLIFCGNPNYTGGYCAAAPTEKDLLDGALPQLVARLGNRGGFAAFVLACSDERRERIQARIVELEPEVSTNGSISQSPLLTELLDRNEGALLESQFGGVPIPFEHVTFETAALDRIQERLAATAEAWRQAGELDMARAIYRPHAERLPSGDLKLVVPAPGNLVEIDVASGDWSSHAVSEARIAGRTSTLPEKLITPMALHGGRVLPPDAAQLMAMADDEAIVALMTESGTAWVGENPDGLKELVANGRGPLIHEELTNGSLRTTAVWPDGRTKFIDVPEGRWHEGIPIQGGFRPVISVVDPEGPGVLFLTKEVIESANLYIGLKALAMLSSDDAMGKPFQARLLIEVSGYDDDPRELYVIPEVRAYFQALSEKWPYWLYFLIPDPNLYQLLFGLHCTIGDVRPEPNGQTRIWFTDMSEVAALKTRFLAAMRRIESAFGHDEYSERLDLTIDAALDVAFSESGNRRH